MSEMELTMHLPCTHLRPASMMSNCNNTPQGTAAPSATLLHYCMLPGWLMLVLVLTSYLGGVDHEWHLGDLWLGDGDLEELLHGGQAVEHAVVHVHVQHHGAVLHLKQPNK